MTALVEVRPFRILVAGFINLNVIDGSAFFIAGLARMCAEHLGVEVTLVTANPIRQPEVLIEVAGLPNVTIVDPYRKHYGADLKLNPAKPERAAYSAAVAIEASGHDAVIVRDNAVALELLRLDPSLQPRLAVYLTGVSDTVSGIASGLREDLEKIQEAKVRVACQTPQMVQVLAQAGFAELAREAFILPPHVPDADGSFESQYHFADQPHRLSYAGKFFSDWIPDQILAGFKAAVRGRPELELTVAGDHFKDDPDRPNFVRTVRYLLDTTPGVRWEGRLPRSEARELIRRSHVGIGWRGPRLSTSTELSTKILEYGALARPAILNRTLAHEALLGSDYPLFVDSIREFRGILSRLPNEADLVELAARRCFEASKAHWYSAVSPGLLDWLGCNAEAAPGRVLARLRSDASPEDCELDQVEAAPLLWGNLLIDRGSTRMTLWAAVEGLRWTALVRRQAMTAAAALTPSLSLARAAKALEMPDEVRALKSELYELHQRLDSTSARLVQAEARLNALRKSRLGRVQRWIWRQRASRGVSDSSQES